MSDYFRVLCETDNDSSAGRQAEKIIPNVSLSVSFTLGKEYTPEDGKAEGRSAVRKSSQVELYTRVAI